MAPAPWDDVPAKDTLFVLVTGTNSGVGMGIGERVMDEFLAQRSLSSHLILIATTRSAKKSAETIRALRRYLKKTAHASKALRARAGYDPREAVRRVHILSVQLDLTNLPSVYAAADQLVHGTVGNPAGDDRDGDFGALVDVRIPRLDAVIFNAGIGGWTRPEYGKMLVQFATRGWIYATTCPRYKASPVGQVVRPVSSGDLERAGRAGQDVPELGQIFCANVFGHYLLARALLPLLTRPAASDVPAGRVIWESSIGTLWDDFSPDDFQAVRSGVAYESTKYLTDLLVLSADLPSVRPLSAPYFDMAAAPGDDSSSSDEKTQPARRPLLYLCHPGIVATKLFPLNPLFYYGYVLVVYVALLLGSPWHVTSAYRGAKAATWLALAGQEELDAQRAERVKWGSACGRLPGGPTFAKATEVENWGWDGSLAGREALARDEAAGVLRRAVGRVDGYRELTGAGLREFEARGAACWREMERLRAEWEARLAELGKGARTGGKAGGAARS